MNTPETDANEYPASTFIGAASRTPVVHSNLARKLERERDAALAQLESMTRKRDNALLSIATLGDQHEREIADLKETTERYRLEANRFEAEAMQLKDLLKECDDAISACLSTFSCRTFEPLNWELPPYK
jgi:chromosome segregation ATPase